MGIIPKLNMDKESCTKLRPAKDHIRLCLHLVLAVKLIKKIHQPLTQTSPKKEERRDILIVFYCSTVVLLNDILYNEERKKQILPIQYAWEKCTPIIRGK